MEAIKKTDRGLLDLLSGILISGVFFTLIGLFRPMFTKISLLRYAVSLWLGIIMALGFAFHMWHSLNKAFYCEESRAGRIMATGYLIRYLLAAVLLIAVYYSGKGYILAAFLGLMSLKTGAYLAPLSHKIWNPFLPEELPEQKEKEEQEILQETLPIEEQKQGGE